MDLEELVAQVKDAASSLRLLLLSARQELKVVERLLAKEICLRASKQDNSELRARLAVFASSMDVANNLRSLPASQLAQCREDRRT